jgi:protein-L-isoaspartate(D-aspartate) O-methyltransferase
VRRRIATFEEDGWRHTLMPTPNAAPDSDLRELRERLVRDLQAAGHLHSEPLADAFRIVPRHVFLPGIAPARAYRDEAHPTKWSTDGRPISSSSQPAIMAIMLEQLAVEPGDRVLEIGAGTGYNAALLAHLVDDTGTVVTVDIDEDLVVAAREHLAACGLSQVTVVCGDGGYGWPSTAPYDRIIVTVGASDLPPAWIEQLAPHGRLVVPLSLRGIQRSIAFEPVGDHLESRSSRYCGFIAMRGAFASEEMVVALGDEPGLFIGFAEERPVDAKALHAALADPGNDVPTETRVTVSDLWDGLGLWLALNEPDIGQLFALDAAADRRLVPPLVVVPTLVLTAALLGKRALAALVRRDGDDAASFELAARAFGPKGEELADRLAAHVRAWDAADRPSAADLRVSAYRPDTSRPPAATATITLPHICLALDWQQRPGGSA